MAFSPERLHSSLHCHIAQNLALFWRDNNYVLYRLHSVYAFIHFNGHPPIKASPLLFVAGTASGVAGVQLNYRGPFFLRGVCRERFTAILFPTVFVTLLPGRAKGSHFSRSASTHALWVYGFFWLVGWLVSLK